MWPWNLLNDLKKHNRAPLLYYIKLCASFHNHQRIQTGVTVWKCSILVKIGNILSRVTLKFDGWHKKKIGHLFYIMPSLVHHFRVMGEFKLELQSGKAQFGSKSVIFCPVLLWNLTVLCIVSNSLVNSNWSYVHCFKSLWWIQTWVTVRKRWILVKIGDMTLKFDGRPWKIIGHIFYAASSFVHHFIAISEFKLEL